MSRDNVEIVRQLYPGPVDYVRLLIDPEARETARAVVEAVTVPDFETVSSPGLVPLSGAEAEDPSRPIFYGFDGFVAGFGEWLSAWETWVVNPTEFVEL